MAKQKDPSLRRAVLACIGAFLTTTGAATSLTMAQFFTPVASSMGFKMAAIALHTTILGLCSVITQPIAGRLFNRFSDKVKGFGVFGAVISLVCFLLLSRCTQLYQFYLVSALASLALPIVTSLFGVFIVNNWFEAKRSFAISIVMVGTSAGTVVYTQVARYAIEHFGWRMGYICVGITIFCVVLLGTALISAPPEHYGLLPYGFKKKEGAAPSLALSGITAAQALRMPGFWCCELSTFLGGIYVIGVSQFLTQLLQTDYLITAAAATSMLSLYSIVTAACKPVFGIVYDKIGAEKTIISTCSVVFISIATLAFGTNPSVAGVTLVVFGACNVFCTVITSALVADRFGRREYAAIMGYVMVAFTLGSSLTGVVSGWFFDMFGTYRVGFKFYLVLCVISTALMLYANRDIKRRADAIAAQEEN